MTIPKGWVEKKLDSVVSFLKGKNVSKNDIDDNGQYECIRYGELYTEYNEIIKRVISKTNLLPKNNIISKKFDILIPSSGETQIDIAKASCVLIDGIILGGDINILRGAEYGIFLSYHLNATYKQKIAQMAQGNSVVHLYASQLKKLKILLPPLPEQIKIADILSTWDRAIEAQIKLIANSETLKKALMQQLLTGKKRLQGFDGVWEETQLFEIATIIMGSSPKSVAYNNINMGIPLIQGNGDIRNRISEPRVYTSEITKQCIIGDILLSVRAPVGEVSMSNHCACIGRGIAAIRVNKKGIQKYLWQWMLYFEDQWTKLSQGSTFESVNSNDIRALKISLPPPHEQTAIANILSDADREIELQKQKLSLLKQEKSALMQDLLTGKRRVVV